MQRSIPAGRLPAVGASAAQGGLPAVAVPAVAAEDHPSQKADQRLGPRVPAIVVSPLIPRNTVDHTPYDHASIPATVERDFRLASLTARDEAANDVFHLLSLDAPRSDTPSVLDPPPSPDSGA